MDCGEGNLDPEHMECMTCGKMINVRRQRRCRSRSQGRYQRKLARKSRSKRGCERKRRRSFDGY